MKTYIYSLLIFKGSTALSLDLTIFQCFSDLVSGTLFSFVQPLVVSFLNILLISGILNWLLVLVDWPRQKRGRRVFYSGESKRRDGMRCIFPLQQEVNECCGIDIRPEF